MHEVLVNRLGGLSLPRKSVVRLTDRPDMTLDVYRGRKTTMQQHILIKLLQINKSVLYNADIKWDFLNQDNLKNLGPSYNSNVDF